MANGARAEGIEANLFFTFFGLDAITKKRHEHIKVATVGNTGLHLATIVGALPGMPGLMTSYLGHKMAKLDIPPIPEFMVFGGMMVGKEDIPRLVGRFASAANFFYSAKLFARYVSDRLRYPRGTRLMMGIHLWIVWKYCDMMTAL